MCDQCQMSQIYILDDVKIYLISIVYKTWPDPLHHFSGQPLSTSSLQFLPKILSNKNAFQ